MESKSAHRNMAQHAINLPIGSGPYNLNGKVDDPLLLLSSVVTAAEIRIHIPIAYWIPAA